MSISGIDYAIIIIYLSGMVGVGFWFAKKHEDFDDNYFTRVTVLGLLPYRV